MFLKSSDILHHDKHAQRSTGWWQDHRTWVMVNQHHPLDARYYSVVADQPSTELIFGFTLVTNCVRNRSHI
jgi:hypothetical protein